VFRHAPDTRRDFPAAACASVALVAQSRYIVDAPGRWKPWTFTAYGDDVRRLGVKATDLKAIEAQLLKLNAIIKNTAGFTAPVGFSIDTAGMLDPPTAPNTAAFGPALTVRPLPVELSFGPFGIFDGASGKRDDGGETSHIRFVVNQLGAALFAGDSRVNEFENIDTDVARRSPAQPDAFGIPRYFDTLVLKKSPEPIWTAVTFGETLDLVARGIDQRLTVERDRLAQAQKVYDDIKDPKKREERMAEYRKIAPLTKDPGYVDKMAKVEDQKDKQADVQMLPQIAAAKAVVTKSEQELASAKAMAAGLSAADKAAPSCYAIADKVSLSRFRRVAGTGCDPLVRPNYKVFNPALPRTAPQLLILDTACMRAQPRPEWAHGCTANTKLLQTIDKAALLAWLQ
jgi:hypothetical protein